MIFIEILEKLIHVDLIFLHIERNVLEVWEDSVVRVRARSFKKSRVIFFPESFPFAQFANTMEL